MSFFVPDYKHVSDRKVSQLVKRLARSDVHMGALDTDGVRWFMMALPDVLEYEDNDLAGSCTFVPLGRVHAACLEVRQWVTALRAGPPPVLPLPAPLPCDVTLGVGECAAALLFDGFTCQLLGNDKPLAASMVFCRLCDNMLARLDQNREWARQQQQCGRPPIPCIFPDTDSSDGEI